MVNRYLRNLFTTRRALHRAFPPALLDDIERAVAASERQHSGELRVAIETALDVPSLWRGLSARDRALAAFVQLGTWDTAANNGVLIYLLLAERDIEIVADRGFHGKVSADEWRAVCQTMETLLGGGDYRGGAMRGIELVTALVSRHYPPRTDDSNELPDQPVLL
ncbi:MAG: TPM domain-containing protein [Halioglobus sp.]